MISNITLYILFLWVLAIVLITISIIIYSISSGMFINNLIDNVESEVSYLINYGGTLAVETFDAIETDLNTNVIPEMEAAVNTGVSVMVTYINNMITTITKSAEDFYDSYENTLNHLETETTKYLNEGIYWMDPVNW